jgi:hypothetical protein
LYKKLITICVNLFTTEAKMKELKNEKNKVKVKNKSYVKNKMKLITKVIHSRD